MRYFLALALIFALADCKKGEEAKAGDKPAATTAASAGKTEAANEKKPEASKPQPVDAAKIQAAQAAAAQAAAQAAAATANAANAVPGDAAAAAPAAAGAMPGDPIDESKVIQTASGLKLYPIREAQGAKPAASDTVEVHYTGWRLEDGQKFDSSVDRGQPATFPLNQVIPGWTEGLQLMAKGSKYKLVIPGNLAYGNTAAEAHGRPHGILVFDVELLNIVGK